MDSPFLISAIAVGVIAGATGCGWDVFAVPSPGTVGGTGGLGGAGGQGGGGGGGAGGGGGVVVPSGCGRIDLLQDFFDDGITGHIWSVAGVAQETSGPYLTADPGSSVGLYRSTRRYNLTNGTITVAIDGVPDQAVSGAESASFRIELDDGRFAEFRANTATLEAGIQQNNLFQVLSEPTVYDPNAHSIWRFREEDGELLWQVSGDGSTFTDLATASVTAVFPDVTRMRVAVGASRGASGPASTAQLDDLVGQSTDGDFVWCPMEALRDDFEDSFLSPDWLNSGGTAGVGAIEADGQLVFTLPANVAATRQYLSSQAYDLTSAELRVEVIDVSAAPSTTYVELRGDREVIGFRLVSKVDMDTMEEVVELEAIVDTVDEDPPPLNIEPYDPVKHRWLRVRDDAGAIVFETSDDGAMWSHFATQSPAQVSLSDFLVALGVTTPGIVMAPGQTRFDNVNVASE